MRDVKGDGARGSEGRFREVSEGISGFTGQLAQRGNMIKTPGLWTLLKPPSIIPPLRETEKKTAGEEQITQ